MQFIFGKDTQERGNPTGRLHGILLCVIFEKRLISFLNALQK